MTELEAQLSKAFNTLAKQYDEDSKRSAAAISSLSQQVQTLSGQVINLQNQLNEQSAQVAGLLKVLDGFNRQLKTLAES